MDKYGCIFKSPIGDMTIIADDVAVSVISFGQKNINGLSANSITQMAVQQLEAYFEGKLRDFTFPMAQDGTEFQKEVWQNLLKIPYAATISYAKFSAHKPLAIRAIAAANGRNNIAIVVPCHRVIGSDGKLVGYAGELWRKKWLLQHEREVAQKGQTELKF